MNDYRLIEVTDLDGVERDRCLLYVNDRAFKVDGVVGAVARLVARDGVPAEAAAKEAGLTEEQYARAIRTIDEVLERSRRAKTRKRRLHLVLLRLRLRKTNPVIRLLSLAFRRPVAAVLLVGAAAALVFWLELARRLGLFARFPSEILGRLDPLYFAVGAPAIVLSLVAHELGHASALRHYGEVPAEIGVGLYFLTPVFFSNVNAAWKLRRRQRIVVSLGGTYFELVLSIALIPAVTLSALVSPALVERLVVFVVLMLAGLYLNLVPVLGRDGYWIALDLFGIESIHGVLREMFEAVRGRLGTRRTTGAAPRRAVLRGMSRGKSIATAIFCLANMAGYCAMGTYMVVFSIRYLGRQLPGMLANLPALSGQQRVEMVWGAILVTSVAAIARKRIRESLAYLRRRGRLGKVGETSTSSGTSLRGRNPD